MEWFILNGNIEWDEEGEYTHTEGKKETVIDYAIVDDEVWRSVNKLEVGNFIDSDNFPLIVTLVTGVEKIKRKRK